MRLPIIIIDLISSFNGSQSELNTERGLRFMFLMTGKFFSWGLGNRDETLHRFLELYDIKKSQNLVELLLKDEKTWKSIESYWATEFQVKEILCTIQINNDKNCSHKNKLSVG